ncbi:MAG TPA: LysM domain-containing protein [Candidatus Limnocylindrales bacterium]|nr:LysM domain-containing protein [Candidatus Limnocylindrales bacterium]
MSDRGLPIADGAHACPFVAFEDDRDERASVPDHRHRCYADAVPAPRALAHQEAYCLSSAFPVCPTFQDWARREAARARGESGARPAAAAAPIAAAASKPTEAAPQAPPAAGIDEEVAAPEPPPPSHDNGEARRNPPRDWSAPPPWLASSGGPPREPADPPSFLASRSEPGQGLAGSTADQWAGGPPPPRQPSRSVDIAPAAAAAGAVSAAAAASASAAPPGGASSGSDEPPGAPPPAATRRPRAYDQHLGGPSGPDWERPRRYEAYPTIRTRVGIPAIPRLAVMAAALGIAAVALFFLPALLGLGSPDTATSSPSATPRPSRSIAPTPTPAPTPTIYVIQAGDTLSKIATDHGLTLDQLMAANPDITDPNRITEGQRIIIPVPAQEVPDSLGGSAAPSGSPPP